MTREAKKSLKITPFNVILYLIYAGLIIGFGVVIRDYSGQLEDILNVLRQASWIGLVGVIGLLLGTLVMQSELFRSLYELFGFPAKLRRISALYLTTRFVNVVVPSGGLAGIAPFIQDAKRRNLPSSQIVVINLTYIILWYSTFALFLAIGLVELFLVGQLQWFEVVAGGTLFGIIILVAGGIVATGMMPGRIERMLFAIVDYYGRILKRPTQTLIDRISIFIEELETAFETLKEATVSVWIRLIGLAFANELLNLSILFLLSWIFGLPFRYGTLVAAYSMGILFFIISPTPGGLGFVEGVLLLVLTSLGHTQEEALVLMLSYRGITFWLPFMLGFCVTLFNKWHRIPT